MDLRKYIGIPYLEGGRTFDGIDCWGLARLVLKEEFGIEIPSFEEITYHNKQSIPEIVKRKDDYVKGWVPLLLPDGKPDLVAARPGDGILMRMRNAPIHVGVVLVPRKMLHIDEGINSVCEEFNNFMWQKRILGVYRHESRVDSARNS